MIAGLVEAEGRGEDFRRRRDSEPVTKRLSTENFKWGSLGHLRAVGSLFTSALSMAVTERDGNNGTQEGRQAGRHTGRAGALVR